MSGEKSIHLHHENHHYEEGPPKEVAFSSLFSSHFRKPEKAKFLNPGKCDIMHSTRGWCHMLIYLSMIESESDKSLFEQLYIRYKGLMYHIAYRILQNREDAEDAVHQAFVSIAKNIKKITEVNCPKTYGYIVTIIERKSIDILRANKHIVSTDFEESEPGIEIPPPGEGGLADAIAKLNPRYREVILLHYAYGYKTNELANMLDIKQDSVRRLLWRAKEALKKQLEEGGIPV